VFQFRSTHQQSASQERFIFYLGNDQIHPFIVLNQDMQIPTGEDIRSVRENKGLTQSELAERAGVSQPLITRIEGEDVDPTIDTLYSVVSVLNNSTTDLEQEKVKLSMPSVLKDARKRTGYTQGELAEAADVSQPLISRIERQDVNPKASTLRELFSHLDPLPESDDEEVSKRSTTESDLAEKIEWEFENMDGTSTQSAEEKGTSISENKRCPKCDSDLSSYPDPSYCPDCGAEL
jgi:predicted transcriptional regulator